MKKLFWIALLLCFLPFQAKSAAVTKVQQCHKYKTSVATGNTLSCTMPGATSGNKAIVSGFYYGTTKSLSCTDACTCPANANIAHTYTGSNSQTLFICYADISSTANFAVTLTVTCTNSCTNVGYVVVQEWNGLSSSDDSGSESSAAAQTVNFTTANANEWALSAIYDLGGILIPASSFAQVHVISDNSQPGGVNGKSLLTQYQQLAGASTYTTSYTSAASTQPLISVIAFQTSGGAIPTVKVVQSCDFVLPASTTGTTAKCPLTNTVAGNKVVFGQWNNTTLVANQSGNCTEACTLLTNASVHNGSPTTGIGFVDTVSNHSTFLVGVSIVSTGNAIGAIQAFEMNGLGASVDAGSEAAASAATTVNFTTAGNNEWAFMFGLNVTLGTVMVPTNSFLPAGFQIGEAAVSGQDLSATRVLATSGSYTASYTQAGGSPNAIVVAAFTISPAVTHSGFPMVVKNEIKELTPKTEHVD